MAKKFIITEQQINILKLSERVETICESSLNRILDWIEKYDIATISAFRDTLTDMTDKTYVPEGAYDGYKFTKKENIKRNAQMKAKLLSFGYGVTKIYGSYIENIGKNPTEVAEESFFVVNLNNDENFYSNLFKISEYFNQDSFLYKPKGSKAYLVGTNLNDFPPYGEKTIVGDITTLPSKFMSRVKNAAFAFVDKDNWVIKKDKTEIGDDEMNDYDNSYSWKQDDKPTFNKRKALRKNNQLQNEWRKLEKNNGVILETKDKYKGFCSEAMMCMAKEVKIN